MPSSHSALCFVYGALCVCVQAVYVEALIKCQGHDALYDRKAALTLVLPGASGVEMHASVLDEKKRRRLEQEKNKAAIQAGLLLGECQPAPMPRMRYTPPELPCK